MDIIFVIILTKIVPKIGQKLITLQTDDQRAVFADKRLIDIAK